MRRRRSAKIVATLGPASSTEAVISALFAAGADVFRLNMSHGTHEDIAARHAILRNLERKTGRPIAILADLQGPKLRVGEIAGEGVTLVEGAPFRLDLRARIPGDATRAPIPHPEIIHTLDAGATLLLNDGKIRLTVQENGPGHLDCTVLVGGVLSSNKGVNVPDRELPLAPITAKDRADLDFALSLGIDWLALSFVQRPRDIEEVRALTPGRTKIMAKIEKPKALEQLPAIIRNADGFMVARGDLGVEMPVAEVPAAQKRIISLARAAGKPVIVATQMLESMISAPVPTRAEVSDVANALYEGADAVMLSAESAAGRYPAEAVAMMNSIAETVERDPTYRETLARARAEEGHIAAADNVSDAIAAAAREVAETAQVAAICTFTHFGTTAMRVARERPRVPILAMTPIAGTARFLCLVWGLHCVIGKAVGRFREAVEESLRAAERDGFGRKGERIVITAGVPFNVSGSTNILRVAQIGQEQDAGAERAPGG